VMRMFATEQDAQRLVAPDQHRMWRVVSTTRTNRLGQPTAYTLEPGANTTPMVPEGSFIRDRVGFVNSHLWVTPYQDAEMFAAGDYPFLGIHGDGLPAWTRANRPIADRDVVVWYSLGVTHVPRPEDWPVMPAVKAGFKLVPTGFFGENPALGQPRSRPRRAQ
jgi:primary-amine oxidase